MDCVMDFGYDRVARRDPPIDVKTLKSGRDKVDFRLLRRRCPECGKPADRWFVVLRDAVNDTVRVRCTNCGIDEVIPMEVFERWMEREFPIGAVIR